MYNMVFGDPPEDTTDFLMNTVIQLSDVGRFRDIGVERNTNGELVVRLLTRDGGDNRRCSDFYFDEKEYRKNGDCKQCTGCIQTHIIPQNQYYLYDRDWEFDCTYAETFFKVPEQYKSECEKIYQTNSNIE